MVANQLTEKQKRFCLEYMIDLNGARSAIRAGYSKKTAARIAIELLNKTHVAEYLAILMKQKEDELTAKSDEVLRYLTRVMRREESETVVLLAKKRHSYYDESGKKVIREAEEPILQEIPAKLSDANKAAELLGKYYSLYTDKLNVNGDMDLRIVVDYGDDSGAV